MFGHSLQCLSSLLLLLSGFRQFLLSGFFCCCGCLLQFLIHAFCRWLNQSHAVVAVPCSLTLLIHGRILPFCIFNQRLQEILNLVVDLLLLLLQLCQLRLFSLRILRLLFGSVSCLQCLLFQCSHLLCRTFRQL